jgi:hypothetical protein
MNKYFKFEIIIFLMIFKCLLKFVIWAMKLSTLCLASCHINYDGFQHLNMIVYSTLILHKLSSQIHDESGDHWGQGLLSW